MAQSSPARHRLRRTALTVLAAAVAAGLLAVPTATAAAPSGTATAAAAVPTLDWADCGDGFRCASARVPLDYDRPRGAPFAQPAAAQTQVAGRELERAAVIPPLIRRLAGG